MSCTHARQVSHVAQGPDLLPCATPDCDQGSRFPSLFVVVESPARVLGRFQGLPEAGEMRKVRLERRARWRTGHWYWAESDG